MRRTSGDCLSSAAGCPRRSRRNRRIRVPVLPHAPSPSGVEAGARRWVELMMMVSAWWGGMLVGGGALLEQRVGRHTHSLMSSLMRSTHHLTHSPTHSFTVLPNCPAGRGDARNRNARGRTGEVRRCLLAFPLPLDLPVELLWHSTWLQVSRRLRGECIPCLSIL